MKEIKRKKLSCALLQALGAGVALTVIASGAQAQQAQRVDKIEVTGTNIKRIDTETASPVTIITREEIQRSGATTVSEVIRQIPANNAGSFSENSLNSFAAGASAVSLRGLGAQATLILLNGRRLTPYPFANGAQVTFVDLNTIPLEVVDRIEVLKDGASAIYGSDAIAGVINIILRKDFKGYEVGANYSQTSEHDAAAWRATGTLGFGDLAKDRFNFFANFEHRDQDPIMASDRAWTSTGTLVTFGNQTRRSANGFPGNYQARPGTSPGFTGTAPVAGCLPENLVANVCRRTEVGSWLTTVPENKRDSVFGRFTWELAANHALFAEVGYMKNKTNISSTPSFPTTWLRATDLTLQSITPIVLPVGHPNNPWSAPVNLLYSFNDVGPRADTFTSEYTRMVAGLKGSIGNWDYDSAVGYNKNDTTDHVTGFLRASVFNRVLADRSYIFGDRSRNPESLYAELSPAFERKGTSKSTFVDGKVSTELMQMRAGPLGLAVGFEHRREELSDRPDPLVASGDIVGLGATSASGDRNVTSFYGELSIPLLRTLEAQLAARYDKYSDYGSTTKPKFGLKWTPVKSFAIRGTYAEGFRAPGLPEIQNSFAAGFFNGVEDPVRCPVTNSNADCFGSVPAVVGANPALKPELSKSYTVGFVWEPVQDTSLTVDWYSIKRDNEIQTLDLTFLLANEALFPGRVTRGPNLAGDPAGLPGPLQSVNLIYANLAKTETAGIDVEGRTRFNLGDMGKLGIIGYGAYTDKWKFAVDVGEPLVNYNGTHNQPRFNGNLTFEWESGPWLLFHRTNYTGKFLWVGSPFQDCPATVAAVNGCVIKSWTTMDVGVRYTGFKNLTLRAGIRNLNNSRPPLDLNYSELYDLTYHNILGKTYGVGMNYSFK
ncbi:MAG: TonB-dependent receptor [Usitatibacter sp.]